MTASELRQLRHKANLTQQAVADRVQYSRSYINHLERGRSRIPPKMEEKLIYALGGEYIHKPVNDEMKILSELYKKRHAPIDWTYG